MFSRRDDDDHLYDFNASPGNLAAPGTAAGAGAGRAPMTAYRGAGKRSKFHIIIFPNKIDCPVIYTGAPLQSSMGRANNAGAPGSRMGLMTGQSGGGGGGGEVLYTSSSSSFTL